MPRTIVSGDISALRERFGLLLLHSEVATIAVPYFDFGTIARVAPQTTATARRVTLYTGQEDEIPAGMSSLPPHPEMAPALQKLKDAGLRLTRLCLNRRNVGRGGGQRKQELKLRLATATVRRFVACSQLPVTS
jgi:hypothetical protein